MIAALAAGEPVTLDHVDQFVDGAAVNRAGTLTYAALAAAGDMVSITTVDEGAVCTAMLDLYQNEGIIAEPAGALSVAALLEADIEPESTVVCLISGGNNDVSRYGEVLERSLVHLGLKHYFLVDFPQEPGALRRFLDRCSARVTTSRCSSTSSATTGTPGRRWSASNWVRPPISTVCWSGCRPPTFTSRRSSRARRVSLPALSGLAQNRERMSCQPCGFPALSARSHANTTSPVTGTSTASAPRLHAMASEPRCMTIQRWSSS